MIAAIEVRDVFHVHQTPEGDAAALQGLSLTVRERETVTVLGPSGSGKSTFLRGTSRATARAASATPTSTTHGRSRRN